MGSERRMSVIPWAWVVGLCASVVAVGVFVVMVYLFNPNEGLNDSRIVSGGENVECASSGNHFVLNEKPNRHLAG